MLCVVPCWSHARVRGGGGRSKRERVLYPRNTRKIKVTGVQSVEHLRRKVVNHCNISQAVTLHLADDNGALTPIESLDQLTGDVVRIVVRARGAVQL